MLQQPPIQFALISPSFEPNGIIPERFTCDGANTPPKLIFLNIPKGTVSLALTMEDLDVPHSIKPDGVWDHWTVWNIPPEATFIDANSSLGITGSNTGGEIGYYGPCPPNGEHRYIFKLYALDSMLTLPEGATKGELVNKLAPHLIDQAELMGRYNRNRS